MGRFIIASLTIVFFTSGASAQEVRPQSTHSLPPNSALVVAPNGTSVQLPQFNFFTISTTVLVPDRGTAVLGGVGSSRTASHQNGFPGFRNGATASSLSGGSISVQAQIHDLRAMDRELLAEAAAHRQNDAAQLWATRVEQAKQSTAGRPAMSVAEARRLRDAERR